MKPPPQFSIARELSQVQEAYRRGDLRAANQRLEPLLKAHARRPDVQLAKAMLLVAQGSQGEALSWLMASLQGEPGNPEALMWATALHVNAGRFEEAERLAARLQQVQPDNPLAYSLRATALRGLARFPEAIADIDRAIQLKSDDPNLLLSRARILRGSHRRSEAAETYRQALRLGPFPPAAIDLAEILLKDGQPLRALDLLRDAARAMPEKDRPYGLIAQALTELQRFPEADAQWALAERHASDPAEVLLRRARSEISVGRFEAAESRLQPAIEHGVRPTSSFAVLSTARKFGPADLSLIERMEGSLEAGLPPIQAAELAYALGKCRDDIGDYERAIGHFDEANRLSYELSPQRQRFSPEAGIGFTDFIIEHFTAARVRELAQHGNPSTLPLFVVGMMRSGTTLTEHILSCHSKVRAAGEQAYWTEREHDYLAWQRGTFDHAEAVRLAEPYLALLAPESGVEAHVVDKDPHNVLLAPALHTVFPNARFVHVKRHPVDNLLSLWMTPMNSGIAYAGKRENLVLMYRSYVRMFRHYEAVLPPDRFRTFRYEDITSSPAETTRAMLGYLGLEVEPACFAPERNPRTVLTPSVYQVRQPIHRGSQERWRRYEPWLGPFADLLE